MGKFDALTKQKLLQMLELRGYLRCDALRGLRVPWRRQFNKNSVHFIEPQAALESIWLQFRRQPDFRSVRMVRLPVGIVIGEIDSPSSIFFGLTDWAPTARMNT
jgi:hypothetical protein